MLLLNTLINCVNRMKKHLAISSFFLLFTLVIMAQSKKEILISGRFDNLLLPEFFQQIESQSPCFFYYDAAQLDSIRINLVVQNETLSSVLTLFASVSPITSKLTSAIFIFLPIGLDEPNKFLETCGPIMRGKLSRPSRAVPSCADGSMGV